MELNQLLIITRLLSATLCCVIIREIFELINLIQERKERRNANNIYHSRSWNYPVNNNSINYDDPTNSIFKNRTQSPYESFEKYRRF